jgi:hypothetical protein
MQVAKAIFLIGTWRLLTPPDSLLVLWSSRCILSFARTLGPVMRWGPEPSLGAAARDHGSRTIEAEAACSEICSTLADLSWLKLYNLAGLTLKSWMERFREVKRRLHRRLYAGATHHDGSPAYAGLGNQFDGCTCAVTTHAKLSTPSRC